MLLSAVLSERRRGSVVDTGERWRGRRTGSRRKKRAGKEGSGIEQYSVCVFQIFDRNFGGGDPDRLPFAAQKDVCPAGGMLPCRVLCVVTDLEL